MNKKEFIQNYVIHDDERNPFRSITNAEEAWKALEDADHTDGKKNDDDDD